MLSHPAILERVIDPMRGDLSSELARHILNLQFAQNDRDRCAELSAKAREGLLTDEERLELQDYVNINDF